MGPRARSQRATEAFSSALTQPHITTCNGFSSNKYAALSARAACCERARASMRHAAQECGTLLYIILWQTPQFLCGSKRWHTPCNNSRTSLPVNPQPNARSRISCVSDMLHTWAPAKGQGGGKRTKDNRETPCGLQSCSKISVPRNHMITHWSGSGIFGRAVIRSSASAASSSSSCCLYLLAAAPPLVTAHALRCVALRFNSTRLRLGGGIG